jgi:NifB/MoaA-like Fe-S oxidoreductase
MSAEGEPLRDIIDWLWLTDGATAQLTVRSANTISACTLTRSYGEDWGLTFADPLFDGLMTCRNSCMFCFMDMLPKGMRPSLYERDDDYRLSFLQGNFVTLTNVGDKDARRIIDRHLFPLHVSLHAVTPVARARLMGKNHARGLAVLEELLRAGGEIHAQMVLVPGVNDGDELDETLAWVEKRPRIRSLGIVPRGFTRYARNQTAFSAEDARRLIARVAPWQARSREQSGTTRFQLADEWYLLANAPLPPAEHYDGYPQFEDGIGMLRSFEDDWERILGTATSALPLMLAHGAASAPAPTSTLAPTSTSAHGAASASAPTSTSAPNPALGAPNPAPNPILLVTGEAFAPTLTRLITNTLSPNTLEVVAVPNHFFGGNVNVAGLLTAHDILTQLKQRTLPEAAVVALPHSLFNADGLTLDDKQAIDMAQALKRQVIVVPCTAEGITRLILTTEVDQASDTSNRCSGRPT